jgi:16S rRNA (adenine1518-N6/adenine1519-N6)-dimethyltransferase
MPERNEVNVPKVAAARVVKKPKLGQHFLTDESVAIQVVDALGDISNCVVLEIGSGRGALTNLLARRARRLIAIETDRVLAAQLRMAYALSSNVEIIEGDILAIDLGNLFGPKPGTTRPGLAVPTEIVRVVGNIPYFLTSDILLRLFQYRKYFESFVLMVQREVADRLAAKPGKSDYGLLSATAQLYARVDKLFDVTPDSFSPPPKVHSSVIRLTLAPRIEELGVHENSFVEFLKRSFGQKRKTLWNNLKPFYAPAALKAALQKANVKPTVRAEALTLDATARIFLALSEA